MLIQLVQVARSIRIRFGLITLPFRGSVRHFWTTSQGIPGHFLDASDTSIGGGVAFCSGMAPPRLRSCVAGAFTDACGLANLTPEEEPESPAEVRSQRKRCLPSVDE